MSWSDPSVSHNRKKELDFFLIGKNSLNEKYFPSCLGRDNGRKFKEMCKVFWWNTVWFTYLHQRKCSLLSKLSSQRKKIQSDDDLHLCNLEIGKSFLIKLNSKWNDFERFNEFSRCWCFQMKAFSCGRYDSGTQRFQKASKGEKLTDCEKDSFTVSTILYLKIYPTHSEEFGQSSKEVSTKEVSSLVKLNWNSEDIWDTPIFIGMFKIYPENVLITQNKSHVNNNFIFW